MWHDDGSTPFYHFKCGMMMGPLHSIISNLVLIGGAGGYTMPQSYKVGKILDISAVFRLSRVII